MPSDEKLRGRSRLLASARDVGPRFDRTWEDDRLIVAKDAKPKTLLDWGVRQFIYTYDMGDNWNTSSPSKRVRHREADAKYRRYVDGERRAPPEDCGGTPGFETFLEAIANPKHPEHKDAAEWHQGCYGKTFDPKQSMISMPNSESAPSPNAAPPAKPLRPRNRADKRPLGHAYTAESRRSFSTTLRM